MTTPIKREYPALPKPRSTIPYNSSTGEDVYTGEQLRSYADTCMRPLLDEINQLKEEKCALKKDRYEHAIAMAEVEQLRATIERQHELLSEVINSDGVMALPVMLVEAITALQAELPQEKKDGITHEDPYGY